MLEKDLVRMPRLRSTVALLLVGEFLVSPASPSTVLGRAGAVLAADEDERWSPEFGNPFPVAGVDGTVHCSLVHDGALILGGRFRISGSYEPVNLARLDGSSWSAVGGGRDGTVHALGTFKGDLVAAGDFRIARWNGYAWNLLGEGVEGRVSALLEYQSLLLVAGQLTRAGGSPSGPIAAWDGESWRPFTDGLDGTVAGLAMHDGRLVAAGDFSINGQQVTVAGWNGASWQAFGDASLPGAVTALLSHDGMLFTGGIQVHQWDGTGWTKLGHGIGSAVSALAVHDGRLFAGGSYNPYDAPMYATLAQWDGALWVSLDHHVAWGSLIDTAVFDFSEFNGNLIVAGLFQGTGDLAVGSVAGWDEGEWSTLGEPPAAGSGMDAVVRALLPFDGRLIAAGEFRRAGALRTRNIAAWDGSRWDSLGPGLASSVSALTNFHGSLIASSGRGIQVWDGRDWSQIGSCEGGGGTRALSVFRGEVIAAGTFDAIDGVHARNIARWDGLQWMPLGAGIGLFYTVQIFCLAVADSSLYVGGTFSEAGGILANGLARWDGESWSEVGSGEGGSVLAMAVHSGELVVSRHDRLRTWNGREWAALAQADDAVLGLAIHDGLLIAGGGFSRIDDAAAQGIAAWDGVAWAPLGSGVDGWAEAMASFDHDLYVGGNFRFVGGKESYYIGRWRGEVATPPAGRIVAMGNPYRPGDPIRIDLEGSTTVSLDVHDLQGRRVRTLWPDGPAAGPVIVQWDGSSTGGNPAPQGIYFLRGHAGSRPIRSKVLLLRP